MRGDDRRPDAMFSYVWMEDRIPQDHPPRNAGRGRRGAPGDVASLRHAVRAHGTAVDSPEKLLRAQLLQILYSIRSERLLMEQLDYNLLFRWFVGFNMDDAVWDATVFAKNRERLLAGDVARAFLEHVVAEARAQHLLSSEHFSVDSTLTEAWRVSGVSNARMRWLTRRRTILGIRPSTSTGSATVTPRTSRRPTRTPGSFGRARA
jgi:transposase